MQTSPTQVLAFWGQPEGVVSTFGGQPVVDASTGVIYSRGVDAPLGTDGYVVISSPSGAGTIPAGSIGTTQLADGAVTTDKLALGLQVYSLDGRLSADFEERALWSTVDGAPTFKVAGWDSNDGLRLFNNMGFGAADNSWGIDGIGGTTGLTGYSLSSAGINNGTDGSGLINIALARALNDNDTDSPAMRFTAGTQLEFVSGVSSIDGISGANTRDTWQSYIGIHTSVVTLWDLDTPGVDIGIQFNNGTLTIGNVLTGNIVASAGTLAAFKDWLGIP